MSKPRIVPFLCALFLLAVLLAACSPAAAPTAAPAAATATPAAAAAEPSATQAPLPTQAQAQPGTATPGAAVSTPAATAVTLPELPEARQVELEFPARINLGDSDVIRLSLVPSQAGYVVEAEFPDHQTSQQEVQIPRPSGYDLVAVARLDGVAFEIAPQGEQVRSLPGGETVSWSWSLSPRQSGRQRLALTLLLRWLPTAGSGAAQREAVVFSRGMEVQVDAVLGLPPSRAALLGVLGLGALLVLAGIAGLVFWQTRRPASARLGVPNPSLILELSPALRLGEEPAALLRALFAAYARLLVTDEFLSGYSGARTFLAQPIRPDGRADAYTIVKLGPRQAIEREHANYETFVKDTLPPLTARIQHAPVRLQNGSQAALRYTFLGEAGRKPLSLRQALLENPDPDYLEKLFSTFGPYWWQQRKPFTFTVGAEYDALLPTHAVLVPAEGRGQTLDGGTPPGALRLEPGDLVTLRHFPHSEVRADGASLSLSGPAQPGQPPLRLRWLSLARPEGASGRVVANRQSLLAEWTQGMLRCGLPDPFPRLPGLLNETLHATRSVIHGDLNLENALLGPGGLVWLIDFAQTREGHTLLDFAHLEAEIVARVLPAQYSSPQAYCDQLTQGQIPLLAQLENLAGQCLFDPRQPREYHLALALACLGALKYANLDPAGRQLLYLTGSYWVSRL